MKLWIAKGREALHDHWSPPTASSKIAQVLDLMSC